MTISSPPETIGVRPASGRVDRREAQYLLLIAMDLAARTGYQLGKKPLLPLFAVSIGASAGMTGLVVATSTLTGLVTTTLLGTLSDRYGRRRLVLIGTALFAFMPFVYLLVRTPGQLLLVRLVHGFATAIYGPVVAALVADLFVRRRAERMGWYRSARTASYLLGPLLGGIVLLLGDFRLAWAIVGLFGLVAFLPALALPRSRGTGAFAEDQEPPRTVVFIRRQLSGTFRNPALLTLGLVQAALYLGLRASDTALPLYGRSVGLNTAWIGAILSIQVAATLLSQPVAGRLADRFGRGLVIGVGLLLVGGGLPLMFAADGLPHFALAGIALGLGEAAIGPAVTTLGTELSDGGNYGATLGMLDAMDNVGKAAGPVLAGLLLGPFGLGYLTTFTIIAGLLVAMAAVSWLRARDLERESLPGAERRGVGHGA